MKLSRKPEPERNLSDAAIREALKNSNGHTALIQSAAVQSLINTAFPVIIISDDNALVFNSAAARVFSFDAKQLFSNAAYVFRRQWRFLEKHLSRAKTEAVFCKRFTFNKCEFELSLSPVSGQNAILILAREISSRSRQQKALRESEERFRQLADFMPQLVWTATPKGSLEFCNKQWFEYTGSKKARSPYSVPGMHPDDIEYARSTWTSALQNGEPHEIAYRFKDLRQPGEYRWFLGRAYPVKNKENKVLKWFGTCTDIHESKMLTDELERRVAERTRVLNEANNSLKRSNAELEQFAYAASHDLQEPLRKIKTFASRIIERSRENMDELSKGYIDKLMESADRMSTLISDVLNYSMLNQIEQRFAITDLNEVVQNALKDYELSITKKNAEIKLSTLPKIEAISFQMNQLFHNLVSNALKFSTDTERPCIEISSERLSIQEIQSLGLDHHLCYHRITVKDNGIGFSQEYRDKIFVIFQRLHPRQKFSGTGIGLALCRKITELHKGRIYAESEESKGSTFHIILPEEQHAKFQYQAPEALYFQAAGGY